MEPKLSRINEGNQLPVSATGLQHVSQICFAYFLSRKFTRLLKTQQPLAREKISTDLKSLEITKKIDLCLTKFKNNQILLNIFIRRFLPTTNLFLQWKSLIEFSTKDQITLQTNITTIYNQYLITNYFKKILKYQAARLRFRGSRIYK